MKRPIPGKKRWQMAVSIALWLLIWQLASMAVGVKMLLPSPLASFSVLIQAAATLLFWQSVFTSLWRIALGFFLGLILGCLLAALAAAVNFIEVLLRPMMLLVRATPVASFTILVLIWLNSRALSTFISFLMVLPVIYSATLAGVRAANPKLLEMADVFHLGFWRRVRAIYLPGLAAGLLASCELALGLCWKSGVAAEVIGISEGTIGERLYQAKIYLMAPELFAWTAVIILLSWLFGRLALVLLRRLIVWGTGGAAIG